MSATLIDAFLEEHRARPWAMLYALPTGDPQRDMDLRAIGSLVPLSYWGPELVEGPDGADADALYMAYRDYCLAHNEWPLSQPEFGAEVVRRPWTGRKRFSTGYWYAGLDVPGRRARAYVECRRRFLGSRVRAYADRLYAEGQARHVERCTLSECSHAPTLDALRRVSAKAAEHSRGIILTEDEEAAVLSDVERIFGPFLAWRQGDPTPEVVAPEVSHVLPQWKRERPGAEPEVPATGDDEPGQRDVIDW
jgi:hypothetical protein